MKVIKIVTSSGAEWLCSPPDDITDWVVSAQLVEVPDDAHVEYLTVQAP